MSGDDADAEEEDWFDQALEDSGSESDSAAEHGETATRDGDGGTTADDGAGADPFDEGFASAFESAPGPGGDELDRFADEAYGDTFEEEFDSSIPRTSIGIEGLDDMIQGGIPERTLMVVLGEAGTGKTTFGLQFVHDALEREENAVFISLEESFDSVVSTADEKGWEFSEYLDRDQLVVLDLDPVEMANSLTSIRSELPGLVQEFGATRLVLDSVSLLEMMYDDQAPRRNEIYDFTRSLKQAGVTTMFTSEASEAQSHHSRYGIIEYLTDAVFVLRYIRSEDFRETRLAVEIQKIRDANHSREMKPFEITTEGISVYRQANIF